MGANNTQETLELLKAAMGTPMPDDILKSFVQPGSATAGLQAYNLEGPSKKLYPVMTPLRNSIARIGGGFAIQANWKAITGINVSNVRAGVSEGKRGGVISHSSAEYFAAFRGYGLENSVTFEANYAAKNFEDVKALAVQQTLESTMIQEERLILGGNGSVALGTTPTPTLSAATSGGSLATDANFSVICVALGLQAYLDVAGANNGNTGQYFDAASSVVPGAITRTNADGTTDTFGGGSAAKSTAATVSVTGPTGKVTATVTAVNGAVGYAWFWGTSGSERLGAVTTINSVAITTATASPAQLASTLSVDNSTSALDFDGLLTQAFKSGSNATIVVQATGTAGTGTPLTADGAGGIIEFEQVFVQMYNRYRMSPSVIYVSSQELVNITKKVIGNGGAPLLRMNVSADQVAMGQIPAGVVVASYLNKVTGDNVPIRVHPNMPAGTVFFFTERLPYPLANVTNVVRMLMRQDYYQIEWPLRSRKYEYGVYADGVLQHYAPFSMGLITNIANG